MPEPIKKTIPWFLILAVFGLTVGFGMNFYSGVKAASKTSQVVVGNAAPSFVGNPYEDPTSYDTSPTNTTTTLTFKGTGDDSNGEDYYLAICKENSVNPTNGGAPTCGGAGAWCISSATTDNTEASCTYEVKDADAESNAWYAFVCDGNGTDAKCSSASQGSGDSGSPFKVNHPPSFSAVTDNPSADPGSNVTWTATASDGDTDSSADTVSLYVCDSSGFTGGASPACTGSELCSQTGQASDPSCSYTIPTPKDDDASPYDAYVYVVDNHGFQASGGSQGTNSKYTVNNVAPSVSSVKLNNEANIDLTESTTANIYITAILSDNNGDADISDATSSAYRTGIGYWSCTSQDDNNCYYNISYSSLESADGDTNRNATFTVSFWYHADPTGTETPWNSEHWEAGVGVSDDNSAWGKATSTAVVEMNDNLAMSLIEPTGNLDFGSLSADNDTGTDYVTSTVAATGNVALDTNMSGEGLIRDGGSEMIDVQNQEYSTTTAPYETYGSGTSLTTSTVEFELELAKTTDHDSTSTDDIFWGLGIPSGIPAGTYYGTTTIAAVKDELSWP